MLKLYHNDMSVCAQKVRMLLCAKNIEWESEHLNLRAGDQQKPEFLKLNPKSLVPVLVHNDKVILESNIIVEYIEEAFPEPALMPASLEDRAKVRWWLIQLDAGLHEQVAVISFCLAFRFQVLKQHESEESLQAFIDKIPDPNRQAFMRDILPNGPKSPRLKYAVFAYNKILSQMAKALESNDWLVGNEMTTADIGFIPYIDRLEQLGLKQWWQDAPQINAWTERVRATEAYLEGIEKWKNPKYVEMMSSLSQKNWNTIEPLL